MTINIPLSKICPDCGMEKPLSEFHNSKNSKYGKSVYCKECKSKQHLKRKGRAEKTIRNPYTIEGHRVCARCKNEYPETPEYFGKFRRCFYADGTEYYCCRCYCIECQRIIRNEGAARNRQTQIRRNKKWYAENAEKYNAERRKRYVEDDEYRENIIQTVLERQKDNPELARQYWQNRRELVQQAEGDLTASLIREVFLESDGFCAYCENDCSDDWHLDHIIPLSRGGTNLKDNLCVACPTCNYSKGDKLLSEWTDRIYERKS